VRQKTRVFTQRRGSLHDQQRRESCNQISIPRAGRREKTRKKKNTHTTGQSQKKATSLPHGDNASYRSLPRDTKHCRNARRGAEKDREVPFGALALRLATLQSQTTEHSPRPAFFDFSQFPIVQLARQGFRRLFVRALAFERPTIRHAGEPFEQLDPGRGRKSRRLSSASLGAEGRQVVRFVCESKLFFMSRPQTMTKASDSGVREQVLVWFERTQRRIFYRDLGEGMRGHRTRPELLFRAGAADGPVKNIDVSAITNVEEVWSCYLFAFLSV
jgi:hypothetical protein